MPNRKIPLISVFGCGNVLLGDDGFGPAVIAELEEKYIFPRNVTLEDVGTGIREYLFDYLLAPDLAPDLLVILDAVDFKERRPGEVFTITPDSIPAKKIHDFSLHQFPTVNLLQELAEYTGTTVHIVAARTEYIPDEIQPGLTPAMRRAVGEAAEQVRTIIIETFQENSEVTVP
ncbi:MAG: coenzyme F420 hydrogenase [Desulfobulbus sp.]|nr:MAG: coenzyme F420 hydrogenase [Desulfobulbus sp.]